MTEDINEALLRDKNEISDIKDKLMNLYTKSETDRKELEAKHERLIHICRDNRSIFPDIEHLNSASGVKRNNFLTEKQTLKEMNTMLMSDISRLKNDLASLQHKEMLLENYYTQQLEARSYTIEDQAQQIKQLHEERNCLLTRLSTIAEDQLSHKNGNIADLRDDERSTKLSELFLELYHKEWTDAFEELTGKCSLSDEKAIALLLGILLNAFQKCREITWKRYEVMKSVTVTRDITYGDGNSSQNKNQEDSTLKGTLQLSLSVDQEKEIKMAWKQMSSAIKTQALDLVRSILLSGFGVNDKDMPNVSSYLISCVEICWKMGLQEKPLHLDIDAEIKIGPEKIFNAEKFRPYTKTGNKVAYVVWPALFLHEEGQLLTKGIAQGC